MPLPGMLAEVTTDRVRSLLHARPSELLEDTLESDLDGVFDDLVRGAAVEVVILVGDDPQASRVRALAVEAISLQTASQIEYASFPEQQTAGDAGRGYQLHQRYRELLARLTAIIEANGGVVPDTDDAVMPTGAGLPRGRFPEPMPYPDPVRVRVGKRGF